MIQEGEVKKARMANLAIVGSHTVNGVADLHTRILKSRVFKEFDVMFKDRMRNVTNGITPRRWLYQANPGLSRLISSVIGPTIETTHPLCRRLPISRSLDRDQKGEQKAACTLYPA